MGTAISKQSKRKHASLLRQKPRLPRMAKGKYNGKPVFDAKAPLIVKISRRDVVEAKKGNPEECAAARALNREQPILAAHVYRSRVFIEFDKKVMRYVTPGRLRQETISFDRGSPGEFMEGDYKLLPPSESLILGNDHRPSNRGGGKDKKSAEQTPVKGARPISRGRLVYTRKGALQ